MERERERERGRARSYSSEKEKKQHTYISLFPTTLPSPPRPPPPPRKEKLKKKKKRNLEGKKKMEGDGYPCLDFLFFFWWARGLGEFSFYFPAAVMKCHALPPPKQTRQPAYAYQCRHTLSILSGKQAPNKVLYTITPGGVGKKVSKGHEKEKKSSIKEQEEPDPPFLWYLWFQCNARHVPGPSF